MTHKNFFIKVIGFVVAVMTSVMAPAETLPMPTHPGNPLVLGNKRVTLITPTLFRLEYAREGRFLDLPTMFAANRDSMMQSGYSIEALDGGRRYKIDTGKVRIILDNDNLPFGQINTEIHLSRMGREQKISARNLHSKKRNLNLGGSIATLDAVHGEVPLDDGLLSEDGWYFLIDTGTEVLRDGWFALRDPSHVQDQYCFVYGDDFHAPFSDLGVISGRVPMTRKYVHGIWYSRWYPYTSGYVDTLVAEYRREGFPLDNVVMDMDWHKVEGVATGIGHNFTKGWTGYSWNRELIPDPKALIDRLHADSITVSVNEHPHDGIRPHEDCYADFMHDMGYNPADSISLLFDASSPKYIDRFLHHTRKENSELGVDFYWLDWQQDYLYPYVPGTNMRHVKWLNRLFYQDLERDNTRGISYSRWGGWGDHRYPINFSGDATGNWDVLAFEVKLSQTGGNGGCYFWVHDTGGFHGIYDPELHTRWSQFGALSAALRVHASRGKGLDRRPWLWGDLATEGMHAAYTFRSQAMPYIYSCVRRTHETMLPLNRCMFVDYPTDTAAYNRYGQYLFGDILLAAPLVTPGKGERKVASTEVWFPADADWYDYFTDEPYCAGTTATVSKDLASFPLFVKGGHVLPLQPFSHRPASVALSNLILRVYPGKDGDSNTFTLYEDDGISLDYREGRFAKTALTYSQQDGKATVAVAPAAGEYEGQLTRRAYTLELCGYATVSDVRVDGRKAKAVLRDGRYCVDIPARSIRKGLSVSFSYTLPTMPRRLEVGTTYSVFGGFDGLTAEALRKAKASGIDHLEVSLTGLVNGDSPLAPKVLAERFAQLKASADSAGVNIWSIHMPYGADCDPSHTDETIRSASEAAYRSYIAAVAVLNPEIILFHPSWRLGLNERPQRIDALVRTLTALNPDVKAIGASMVVENLLGPQLLRKPGVERPLGRTVEEMTAIMDALPADIYAAVDMNHIAHPEQLIDALGTRIKSVHIADGNGKKECHLLPGRGENDWDAILAALDRAGYNGPFLYEIKGSEGASFRELKQNYDNLHRHCSHSAYRKIRNK